MRMKKLSTALLTVAAVSFAAIPALADSIKIGEINHYKRMAAFANPYKNGILLATEEVNAAGGVLGQPLEFIFRDDQGKPGEAVKIAEELVTRDGVALVTGTIFSHVGLAIASHAPRRQAWAGQGWIR